MQVKVVALYEKKKSGCELFIVANFSIRLRAEIFFPLVLVKIASCRLASRFDQIIYIQWPQFDLAVPTSGRQPGVVRRQGNDRDAVLMTGQRDWRCGDGC